jgi:hypothetical protein
MFSVKVMSNQCVVFKKGSFLPLAWEGDLIWFSLYCGDVKPLLLNFLVSFLPIMWQREMVYNVLCASDVKRMFSFCYYVLNNSVHWRTNLNQQKIFFSFYKGAKLWLLSFRTLSCT